MYPLQPFSPNNNNNLPPRYSLPRSKASPTVSLSHTSANAYSGATTSTSIVPAQPASFIQDPCPSSLRFIQRSKQHHQRKKNINVIPFPASDSAPAVVDITMSDASDPMPTPTPVPELGAELGLNDALSRYQQPRTDVGHIHRRRRSAQQQQQQQQHAYPYPHWNTYPTPSGTNTRKHPNPPSPASSSLGSESDTRPRPKRPRKNKRVIADIQFVALVHRSILCRVRASDAGAAAAADVDGGDDKMQVDGTDEPELEEKHRALFEQERLLLRRLWSHLVDSGLAHGSEVERSSLLEQVSSLNSEAGLSSGSGGSMEIDTLEVLHFPMLPPGLPPPPTFSSPSPTPTSNLIFPFNNPLPLPQTQTQILSMPHLVAALIMRYRYRDRDRDREREKTMIMGRLRPSETGSTARSGTSLFGRWKASFSLSRSGLSFGYGEGGAGAGSGAGVGMGTGRGRRGGSTAGAFVSGAGNGNGVGERRERLLRSSPLSTSVFSSAGSGSGWDP